MTVITRHAPGTFSWPELATSDQSGGKKFYMALFGWTAQDNDMGENGTYTILRKDGKDVGGLYTLTKDQPGVPPNWMSYVAVDSADQTAARAKELGGQVHAGPFDVAELGRMAVMQDPTGAMFAIWEAKQHIGAGVLNENGAMTWNELLTRDTKKAAAFYTALFPWKTESMAMSDNMDYTVFKRGEANAGGLFAITPEMGPMPPNWSVYFQVEDTDAMAAKATSLGAKIAMPPTDIPQVGRFAVVVDPQGAPFGIIAYA